MTPVHSLHLSDFHPLRGVPAKNRVASEVPGSSPAGATPSDLPSDGSTEAAECVSGRAVVGTESGYSVDEIDLEQIEADEAWRAKQRRYQDWHYQQYGTYGD